MSQRARTGIIIALIGIAVIAVGIFVLVTFVRRTLAPLPQPTPEPVITEKVVVATRDMELGTLLGANDVTEVDVPVEAVPRNAMSDAGLVIGRFTKIPLVGGEMVMEHHLADPTNVNQDLAFILDQEQVLMAFPANDLMSTLNVIQRGDIVDILVSTDQSVEVDTRTVVGGEDETESRLFTFDAFQLVEVTALVVDVVQQQQQQGGTFGGPAVPGDEQEVAATPTPQPSEVRVRAYLLALSPQDALVLKHLRDTGAVFDIVLRSPTSSQLFELEPVIPEFLIDRYGLEIPERGGP